MGRITGRLGETYFIDKGQILQEGDCYRGEAIEKLAKFENFYEDLLTTQDSITKELEDLKNRNRERSYQYKELMALKLTNKHILRMFEASGL